MTGWRAALGVAVLAGAASLALPATLGYDAWAWTVWGRELAHLDLATTAGPSFKPLPVLALAPLSVLGAATPVVWMGLMRAAAVLSLLLAYRLGARLAGPLAGAVAALSLALSADLYRTALLGSAEPVLIALTLGAADRHLAGRRDWALVLVALAGLIRPEAWVLLGAYGVYVWLREPRLRPLVAAAVVLPPVLWLGLDWIGSGNPLHAQLDGDLGHRGQRRERQGARAWRSCAAPPTRSSSPRSSSRRSGWASRRAAAIARCCRSPRSRWAGSRSWRSWPRSASPAPGATWRRRRRRCASWPASGSCGCSTPSRERRARIALGVAIAVLALVPALLRAREDARMLSVARSQADQRDELLRAVDRRRRPRRGAARRAAGDQPVAADGAGLGARRRRCRACRRPGRRRGATRTGRRRRSCSAPRRGSPARARRCRQGVRTRRRDPLGALAGAARRGVSARQALP